MQFSQLQRALNEEFGHGYAGVLLRDHYFVELGGTAVAALESGIAPKIVWLAVCKEFDIPVQRQYARGFIEIEKDG